MFYYLLVFFCYCHLLLICKLGWILMLQMFGPLRCGGSISSEPIKTNFGLRLIYFFIVGFNYWGGCNSICICPFCICAMALFIQNKSSNNVSVFSILGFFFNVSLGLFLFVSLFCLLLFWQLELYYHI